MNGAVPGGVNPFDLVFLLSMAVVIIFSWVSLIVISGRGRHSMPPGGGIRTRPPRDLKTMMKWQKEKEEEMKDDGHERR